MGVNGYNILLPNPFVLFLALPYPINLKFLFLVKFYFSLIHNNSYQVQCQQLFFPNLMQQKELFHFL